MLKDVREKNFDPIIWQRVEKTKEELADSYRLHAGNNVNLICEKLSLLQEKNGLFVECGVFNGTSLFSVALFCKKEDLQIPLCGFDTFEGFPEKMAHIYDQPPYFNVLFSKGEITKEHLEKAKQRTKNFTDTSALEKEYFLHVDNVFKIKNDFPNVTLVKGAFAKTLPEIKTPIVILYLDCDLYQSYLDCFTSLYNAVIPGGVIIFDEYYSLKYPGARVAVNEFFNDKNGYFERYKTPDTFERWCFVKT